MSDSEKKFKLDELPDKGSAPDKIHVPTVVKTQADPRLKDLKNKTHAEKDEAFSRRWFFDKPKHSWGWAVALAGLVILEKSGHMKAFAPENLERLHDRTAGIANWVIDGIELQTLLRHPLYLAVLIPFIFKWTKTEGLQFIINFNGIDGVENIKHVQTHGPTRVFIKWSDIKSVDKIVVNKREVLQIHSAKGPQAQLIWDIDDVKKKVIKQILKGLVANKHPLRIFIEKDVT